MAETTVILSSLYFRDVPLDGQVSYIQKSIGLVLEPKLTLIDHLDDSDLIELFDRLAILLGSIGQDYSEIKSMLLLIASGNAAILVVEPSTVEIYRR